MKIKITPISSAHFAALTLLLAGAVSTQAATLSWTNTANGYWNTAANWTPNQVPGSGDTAVITNAGVTVSLNSSATVGGIILGTNGPGTVTLSLAGQTLTLNGPMTVNPSGSFTVDSGTLAGNTSAELSGTIGWTAGTLGGTLTLASGSTLSITAGGNHFIGGCVFTNLGTVNWSGGYLYAGGGAVFYNYGLWNAQDDQQMQNYSGGAGTIFNNYGTFRKSGGASEFANSTYFPSGVVFNQLAGVIDVQNGTNGLQLAFAGGGSFTGGYITTNANGLTVLGAGNFTVNGTVTGTNTWADTGTLVGTNVINGALTWVGGTWNNTVVTVSSNSVVNIISAANHLIGGCLFTNLGTVNWSGGYLYAGGGAAFFNYGVWNAQDDQQMQNYYGGTGTIFNNYGTFRKSGGASEFANNTFIANGVVFNQLAGVIDVQNGTNGLQLAFGGGGSFTGGYVTTNVNGLTVLGAGNFTVNGTVTGTNTWADTGTLVGTNVINGALTWVGGTWNNTVVTVSSNSVVNIISTANHLIGGCLFTNLGTVNWSGGYLYAGGGAAFFNYGVWNAQDDQQMQNYYGGTGTVFDNYGTFRKSGGASEFANNTLIANGVVFNQLAGVIDVQNGTNGLQLAFGGGGSFTGGYITTNANGLTSFDSPGNFTLNGMVTGTNTWLSSGNLAGTNVINGALTWVGGTWSGATVTISANTTVLVVGGGGNNDMNGAVVTNNGTVAWASGTIRGGSGTTVYNYGLWDAQSDQTFNNAYGGANAVFNNYGTFRKSGGTNTSYTLFAGNVLFNQLAGVIDVQSGRNGLNLVLQGGGNFTGGYTTTNQLGVTVLSGGNFTLNGTVTATNTVENAGNLVGTNVINGALNWQAGNWNSAVSVTIATNTTLIVAGGGGNNDMNGTLVTNYGTLAWSSGTIRGGSATAIYNHGLWNAQSDQTFNNAYGGANTVFNNYGTFRKSGGTNTSSTLFAGNVVFNQLAGVIDVQSGNNGLNLVLQGGGNFTGGYATTNQLGVTVLSIGNFTLNGTLTGTNMVENAGNLVGTNVINGALSWQAGNWDSAKSVTIATNATVLVAGGTGNNDMSATVVTNYGTVAWATGTIRGGSGTTIYNYGLWNAQSDQTFNSAFGGANTVFNNYGTFRKSGGTGTTSFVSPVVVYGWGTVDAETGTVQLNNGGGFYNGSSFTGAGSAHLAGGTFVLSGNVNSSSNAVLAGASLSGTNGMLSGLWTWTSGSFASGSTLTIATNGLLALAGPNGTTYIVSGTLTNTGTVEANNGTLNFAGAYVQTAGLTLMNGGNLQATQPIQIGGGTLQGAGVITGSVNNNGTLNPGNPLGLLTITGNYAQTANGVLNVVLAGLPAGTNYDRLVVNGNASLAGSFNSSLITNCHLLIGNQFQVLAAGSLTGVYGSTSVPNGFALGYTNSSVMLTFAGVPGSVYRFAWAPIPSLEVLERAFPREHCRSGLPEQPGDQLFGHGHAGIVRGAADQHLGRRFFLRRLLQQLDGWLLIHSGPGHSGDSRAILFWHESFHLAGRWYPGRQPAGDQCKRDLGRNTLA